MSQDRGEGQPVALRVHGGAVGGDGCTHRMYMMTPRDHMSHDLSYFSGPRTSGATGQRAQEGLSPQGLEPRQEPEAGQGGEQEPCEGAGLRRLASGTVWEGSVCVKLGEGTQLPEEVNPRPGWARGRRAFQLLQAGLRRGGERRERPAWGSARSRHRCPQMACVPCLPEHTGQGGVGQGSGPHCPLGHHPWASVFPSGRWAGEPRDLS